jgi:GTP-binding protein
MLANNWAEMPNYFVTSATESVGKEDPWLYRGSKPRGFQNKNQF